MKFFQLTRNERFGLVGMIILLSVIVVYKYYNSQVEVSIQRSAFENKEVKSEKVSLVQKPILKRAISFPKENTKTVFAFEEFNPNQVESTYWEQIGFSKKIAERITKFIKNGGGIKKASDLKSVYGLKLDDYNLIKDSIIIPIQSIYINAATNEDFKRIKGIGDKISTRIIKFREQLGGFYSKDQLLEVYGIDSNLIAANNAILILKDSVTKIDIQKVGMNSLQKHPLIDKYQAEEILKIRSIKGEIDSIEFKNIFTSNEWAKIKHYIEWKR